MGGHQLGGYYFGTCLPRIECKNAYIRASKSTVITKTIVRKVAALLVEASQRSLRSRWGAPFLPNINGFRELRLQKHLLLMVVECVRDGAIFVCQAELVHLRCYHEPYASTLFTRASLTALRLGLPVRDPQRWHDTGHMAAGALFVSPWRRIGIAPVQIHSTIVTRRTAVHRYFKGLQLPYHGTRDDTAYCRRLRFGSLAGRGSLE